MKLTEAILDLSQNIYRLVLTKTPYNRWTDDDKRLMKFSEEEITRAAMCTSMHGLKMCELPKGHEGNHTEGTIAW
jgi:hypothetical protein